MPASPSRSELLLTVEVGLGSTPAPSGREIVEELVGRDLRRRDDLELGGVHYVLEREGPLGPGVAGARVYAVDGAATPELAAHAAVAELELVDADVTRLGRLAGRLEAAAGGSARAARWVVAALRPDEPPPDLWRAHEVRSPARGTYVTPSGRPAPELLCHLAWRLGTIEPEEAASALGPALGVTLRAAEDVDLGGPYREHVGDGGGWGLERVLLRPPTGRLEVTLRTPSLLDLGRLAAAVETALAERCELVEYRAIGDLVRDRVPRVLAATLAGGAESEPGDRPARRR